MTTDISNRSKSDVFKDFLLFLLIISGTITATCTIACWWLGEHTAFTLVRSGYIGFILGLLIAVVTMVPNRPSTNAARRRERIMKHKYGA